MAIYKQIFPTKYPLFEFYFGVWKLRIATAVFRPSYESLAYEYIRVSFSWREKEFFAFRLFDTYHRVTNRIDGILNEQKPATLKRLYEMKKIVEEEIVKIKKIK